MISFPRFIHSLIALSYKLCNKQDSTADQLLIAAKQWKYEVGIAISNDICCQTSEVLHRFDMYNLRKRKLQSEQQNAKPNV